MVSAMDSNSDKTVHAAGEQARRTDFSDDQLHSGIPTPRRGTEEAITSIAGATPAISINNISKRYGLPYSLGPTRIAKALHHWDRNELARTDIPLVLDDVSLKIAKGELVGIIGRNGSGKSTLLKVIAGVTPATAGSVDVDGRLFPMIELNAGMIDKLTGRENVRLLASILGMTRKHIERAMPRIEEFCDLGPKFDMPVRSYSSGLRGRLGFGIAVHTDADVVLIDEVMAVGDLNFRERCSQKMVELRDAGKTVVLVSHNLSAITHLCSRAAFIEQGKIQFVGPSEIAVRKYTAFMDDIRVRKLSKGLDLKALVEHQEGYEITNIKAFDARRILHRAMVPSERLSIQFNFRTPEEHKGGHIGIKIVSRESGMVFINERIPLQEENAGQEQRFLISFHQGAPLPSGLYDVFASLNGPYTDYGELAVAEFPISVLNDESTGSGAISCPYKFWQVPADT